MTTLPERRYELAIAFDYDHIFPPDIGPDEAFFANEELPQYELTFRQAYGQWKSADEASIQLAEKRPELDAANERVLKLEQELDERKRVSEALFKQLHSKNRIKVPLLAGKVKKTDRERRASLEAEFLAAHRSETSKVAEVDEAKEKASRESTKIDNLRSAALAVEEAWRQLQTIAERINDVSTHEAFRIRSIKSKLQTYDLAYETAKKRVSDMTRARLTVQHAHHYLLQAMQICDAVRGGNVSRAVFGFGAMSAIHDYRAAARVCGKAQVCLNDCFRVTEPHLETLPQERLVDYNALRDTGVMQMRKVFDLMYSNRADTSTLGRSIKLMIDRQETAFKHLTSLAVWVQDRVPVCEGEERTTLAARSEARRELATLWAACQGDLSASVNPFS